ncbi:MAG: hypothetical protein PHU46_13930 [Rhodocyclaceae bacterium]|nr:hypothetical protein [Rhodocyclaceae bacterium]
MTAVSAVPGTRGTEPEGVAPFAGNLARYTFLAGLLLVASLPQARADEGTEALKLRYFGSLGATRAASDRIQYVRDLSQPKGSSGGAWSSEVNDVLGVQANYVFTERTAAVAQVVSRYRYDGTFHPELMWAYAHVTSEQGTDLRIGRLGTDFYMLADSRLVGYGNLAISPSLDFFGQLPLFHIDGADISRTFPVGHGLLKGKLFAGYTGEKVPLGSTSWNMGDSPMMGANLDYHLDNWSFRLGYAQLRIKHDWPVSDQLAGVGVPPATVSALSMADKTSRYYSAGLMYERGPVQVQWMLNQVSQESYGYQDYYSSYVLAGYRLDAFTPYAGVARSDSPAKALDTATLAPLQRAAVADALGLSHTNQTTWTVGVRWDFRRNMALKAQWDGIRGRSDSVFLYPKDTPGWSGSTDVFSAVLDFAF